VAPVPAVAAASGMAVPVAPTARDEGVILFVPPGSQHSLHHAERIGPRLRVRPRGSEST